MASLLTPIIDFHPIVLIVAGFAALLWGIDRLFSPIPVIGTGPESDTESRILAGFGMVMGLVSYGVMFALLMEGALGTDYHWFSLLVFFAAGITLTTKPIKDVPIAAIITLLVASGAAAIIILLYTSGGTSFDILGIDIPLLWIIAGAFVVVLVAFILALSTEMTVDAILALISWSPVQVTVGFLAVAQGALLLLAFSSGLWEFIPL